MTSETLLHLEQQASDVVTAAASYLERHWQSVKRVNFKEKVDPVTEFDVRTENELREKLHALLPEAGFIVEEGVSSEAGTYNWVIDPIDQTKNFVGQVPLFYTQIALVEDDIPVLGIIYNPVTRQLFSASRGNGAKLNGRDVSPTVKQRVDEAIIDVDFGDNSDTLWKLHTIEALANSAFRLRITGGAYAPYLLVGGIDAFVVVNQKTKLVDQLPRMILTREAGLAFDEYTISDRRVLLAAPSTIVDELLGVLQRL